MLPAGIQRFMGRIPESWDCHATPASQLNDACAKAARMGTRPWGKKSLGHAALTQ
jgi:hypothetical protein